MNKLVEDSNGKKRPWIEVAAENMMALACSTHKNGVSALQEIRKVAEPEIEVESPSGSGSADSALLRMLFSIQAEKTAQGIEV